MVIIHKIGKHVQGWADLHLTTPTKLHKKAKLTAEKDKTIKTDVDMCTRMFFLIPLMQLLYVNLNTGNPPPHPCKKKKIQVTNLNQLEPGQAVTKDECKCITHCCTFTADIIKHHLWANFFVLFYQICICICLENVICSFRMAYSYSRCISSRLNNSYRTIFFKSSGRLMFHSDMLARSLACNS